MSYPSIPGAQRPLTSPKDSTQATATNGMARRNRESWPAYQQRLLEAVRTEIPPKGRYKALLVTYAAFTIYDQGYGYSDAALLASYSCLPKASVNRALTTLQAIGIFLEGGLR
jgi:hypothetical protein